jgi:hypothetical protein
MEEQPPCQISCGTFGPMAATYKFQCPGCKRSFKANKDLSGRLKRCSDCRGTFTITRLSAAKGTSPAEPVVVHDPELPIDQVFNAMADWRKSAPSLPGSFAREVTFGRFLAAYRVSLDITVEADGRRSKQRSHRDTAELPDALGERHAPKKVVDLGFEHTSQLGEMLEDKPEAVIEAAQRLAKELRPPAGGKFVGRHLVVEHLQVWKAHWVFHGEEGTAWFFGKPLRAYLPHPPKRSSTPAVLATLAALAVAGGLGWFLWSYQPGTAPAVAPPPPAAARPAALSFAKDGLVQLDDGSFLRGPLERRGEEVVVRATALPPWRIESMHIDAPIFLRGEAKRLDDLEGRVKAATSTSSRETLVGLFLEIHRQRDRWTPLAALCSTSELPGDPKARIEALRVMVEKLLEPPAVAAAPAAVAPEAVVKAPAPPPGVALAAGLLAELAAPKDRAELAKSLAALKAEKLPRAELLEFAALLLSRSEAEAGLAVDRLHVKTPQFVNTYEGAFEKRSDAFAKLRLPAGPDVTVYREKDAWVAMLPGGVNVSDARVTMTPAARTASGERLKGSFESLPPERWMSATAAEHLRAAKSAAAPSKDGGEPVLRALAAGHAGAALAVGTPSEILEARVVLHGLGYVGTPEGRWQRLEDRRAAEMGRLLADGKPEDARALLPGSRVERDFFGAYRGAALSVLSPIRSVDDLSRASTALDQALLKASTSGESKNLLALKSSLSGFGICPSCGGTPAKVCSTCRGKGQRTEACLPCKGQGYIITVGIGATGNKTCEACGGRPIRGTRPCEKCDGKGSRSCAKCQGITRLPAATDLSRTRPCVSCGGSGGRGESVRHACSSCAGLGLQLVPAGDPDATLP